MKVGPYRFFFYSADRDEPVHVHVEREDNIAKIWVNPVRLQSSGGFHRLEINKILSIAATQENKIIEAWNEYFNN